ncbi:MAG: hypothetical protein H7A23_15630 [Leptospiraceae bacterium]|nr:hypothetical protein [Leptospiraceae bacterium]MCP5495981.1 hypothetical protein [Leptospiraceae bacterium]
MKFINFLIMIILIGNTFFCSVFQKEEQVTNIENRLQLSQAKIDEHENNIRKIKCEAWQYEKKFPKCVKAEKIALEQIAKYCQ